MITHSLVSAACLITMLHCVTPLSSSTISIVGCDDADAAEMSASVVLILTTGMSAGGGSVPYSNVLRSSTDTYYCSIV